MITLYRLALVAAVTLGGCGGAKDATVTAALSAASAPASAAVSAPAVPPPAEPVTPPTKVATLSLPALTPTAIGALTPMVARASDSSGATVTGAALTWSSADPTIAKVDEAGFVTPLRAGFTTITVGADGVSASGTLSVRGTTRIPARSQYVGINLAGNRLLLVGVSVRGSDEEQHGLGLARRP